MDKKIINDIKKLCGEDKVFENVKLSEYTSFKTGGPADCLVRPVTIEELKSITEYVRKNNIPYYVIGNGTNMLVADEGFRGVIIALKDMSGEISFSDTKDDDTVAVTAYAGCTLARLSAEAAAKGLAGTEFASGIPGSIGGAVVMNAGAYGGEIKDILEYADVLDESGNILRLKNEDLGFGYRKSIIQEKNYIVLMVSFLLKRGDEKTIKAEMRELNERRREKQPLEYPSAGSTFKRPEGLFAGKLIEDSGLKGYRVGDAQVSEKHCGFVVNRGKATSSDIYKLIGDVIGIVYEKTGVQLDPEIKLLGFDE
ncbi:MAG: UDP-N-acetylmuramate dehydrogenase [Lachnospiraceae bacterium]|nr:UDP-N-acetylmuramate dehydrogenase [Lachnospiraceae bacterium]